MASECYGFVLLVTLFAAVTTLAAEHNLKVRNVQKGCSNFDCYLRWKAPAGFKCSRGGRYDNNGGGGDKDRLTFTVKFENWTTPVGKLISLPGCIETTSCRCDIPDIVPVNSIEIQYYRIVSSYKNKTVHVDRDILPWSTMLRSPKFEVSIDAERTAHIKIPKRQLARKGSKITLADALKGHSPVYVVKYWRKGGGNKFTRKFSAENTTFSFALEEYLGEDICFSMSISAVIYDNSTTSPAVCLKVRSRFGIGQILAWCGYGLIVIFVLVSVAVTYKCTRKFRKTIKTFKQNSIPISLMDAVGGENKTKNGDKNAGFYSPFHQKPEADDVSEAKAEAIHQRSFSSGKTPTNYYSEKTTAGSFSGEESSEPTLTEEMTISDASQKDQLRVEVGSIFTTGYIQLPSMETDSPRAGLL